MLWLSFSDLDGSHQQPSLAKGASVHDGTIADDRGWRKAVTRRRWVVTREEKFFCLLVSLVEAGLILLLPPTPSICHFHQL